MSSTEPGVVLQVQKVPSVLECVVQPGRQVLRGAGPASALHPLPWPRASETGKEPWEGQGLKGAHVSLVAHSVLGKYLHTLNTAHYSFLVCSNWSYQLAGLYLHGRFVPKPTNFSKVIRGVFRGGCSYGELWKNVPSSGVPCLHGNL